MLQLSLRTVVLALVLAAAQTSGQPEETYTVVPDVKLTSEAHEQADGYFNLGQYATIHVAPKGIPADLLRQLIGKNVDLVIRVNAPRELKKLDR